MELAEARVKQKDLETRLLVLSGEKKTKEVELATALARIREMESSKSDTRPHDLETHKATARHLQQSIESYKQETQSLEQMKKAVRDELREKQVNLSSSSSSDDETDAVGSSAPQVVEEKDFAQIDQVVVDAALKERKARAETSRAQRPAKSGSKRIRTSSGASGSADGPVRKDSSSGTIAATASEIASAATDSKLSSPQSKRTRKPSAAAGQLSSSVPKHDAVVWFKTYYVTCCQQSGGAPVDDLLLVLDRTISKHRKLMELDLNNYNLHTHDIIALTKTFAMTASEIAKVPSNSISNSFLPVAVDLSHNAISSGRAVAELLTSAGSVLAIDIGFNNWGPKIALEFAENIATYTKLHTFKCAQNMMGSKTASSLLKSLLNSKLLEVLDLSNNALDDKAAPALAALIQSCPLTTLIIKYNRFKASGMKKIAAALGQNPTITDLDLTSCGLGEKSKEFVEILESRENISKLCIGFNKLSSTFVPRFVSFTAKQKNLIHVDIRGLELPSKSTRQIIDSISVNVSGTLQELVLNGNVLDSKCMELLMDFLTRTHVLHSLGLRGCGLPKAALVELLATIKHSTVLKSVDLSGNDLNDRRILESLGTLLQNNTSLSMIGLAACKLDAKNIGPIGQALQFNKTLEKIHVDGNKLSERGLIEFASGMSGNETLKVISIRSTAISARALLTFVSAITAKTQVEVIDAGDNGLPMDNKPFRSRLDQFDAVVVKL